MTKNIIICGVGGQGSLLASRILGYVAMAKDYDVKVSEVHGMAQRGGSVVTYVRYSTDSKVASPVICKGEADIMMCFEQLEAARMLPYLKKNGTLIVNTQKILPMPVVMGAAEYPENIVDKIKSLGIKIVSCDAIDEALKLGNEKCVNVILIGMLARISDFEKELFIEAINNCVPEKHRALNLRAFEVGYNFSL